MYLVNNPNKQLSNPFSTGGGGGHFEAHVQASFVTLMLTGGYAPCLPCWPITKIKLQGKIDGFETDDLIVFAENGNTNEARKLLGQVKHSINFVKSDKQLKEVLNAAWSDFNNPRVFNKNKDVIALITGPLTAIDFQTVPWLLNQAKRTNSVDEFIRNVEQANFSPSKSGEKLGVIEHHLKLANGNQNVPRDQLYAFLRHFYWLGYDLGKEEGVVLSLLHSHISQFNQQYPQWVWSRVVDVVQTWNHAAGTIKVTNLPEDIADVFKERPVSQIPIELTKPQSQAEAINWSQHQHATELALANLIGSWDEHKTADLEILNAITGENYSSWILKARTWLAPADSPVALKNGLWSINQRVGLWQVLGAKLFDQNLDTFKNIALSVLREPDPAFELASDQRYASSMYGKVSRHSPSLRKGLADGLALLGNHPDPLLHCSRGKAETTAILTVRELFTDAGWALWGSLNPLLPTLAEAAPDEFLQAVEKALNLSPCPFDEIFAQEGDGMTGGNYLTGLLWALESLAWDEAYLVRVCLVLGELASHDPGGKWTNRPSNSLSTILLPWLPQTIASVEKRKVAVRTLYKEWPEIAWTLIIKLLPNQHQVSTGARKPTWRNTIPEDWEKGVSHEEYWQQVTFYAEQAVAMAGHDPIRLGVLIEHFSSLPNPAYDRLLEVLASAAIVELNENQRQPLWEKLVGFVTKHRRYPDAEWSADEAQLIPIEAVAEKLAPISPFNRYQQLFSNRDFEFYDEGSSWDEKRNKLDQRRQDAVKELLEQNGIASVMQFTEAVKAPNQVGQALGNIGNDEIDGVLLPEYLNTVNQQLTSFVSAYIGTRFYVNGWTWVDGLDKSNWTNLQISQFFSQLPFEEANWQRVAQTLGQSEADYWQKAWVNPYQKDSNLAFAVDKLIEHGRPLAAIDCLGGMKHQQGQIDVQQCVRALMAAVSTSEPTHALASHHIVDLIKMLQDSSEISADDLFRVEWAYLPLLNEYHGGTRPKYLESRLANDPEFFCEAIRLIYRSKDQDSAEVASSEQNMALATNAYRLLHNWCTPPGTQADGNFSADDFSSWLQKVKASCDASGHLDVAMLIVGGVLIHAPSDSDGLWLHRSVAEALNGKDAETMRQGYSSGIFNSRGVYTVDPTGKPERELAEHYRQKAEAIENADFARLAQTLKALADGYEDEAKRVVDDYGNDH